jgi:hypothetical protein
VIRSATRRRTSFLLSGALLLLATGVRAQSGEGALSLRLEPGVVRADGSALVPFQLLDRQGLPFPVRPGELRVDVDGTSILPQLASFDGEEPTAVCVLVDPSAFRGRDPSAWAQELTAFAAGGGGGDVRLLLGLERVPTLWSGSGTLPPPPGELAERLGEAHDAALWDGILLAIDRLSTPGGPLPTRRILIVLGNGIEGRESRHPVATCVDAADSARVSVWCITVDEPTDTERAGVDRLRTLADRTGGLLRVASPGRGVDAFRDVLARIRTTQGLRLPSLPGAAPLPITLTPGVAAARPVSGVLRDRKALGLSGGGPFPWIPLLAGLVAVGLGGGLLARRRLPIGVLEIRSEPTGTVKVTRRGLTIGGAHGNGLVLPDSRISRNHAALRMEGGKVMLVDLRSSNGTKVNGRAVRSAMLRDGDRIVLADRVEMVWRGGFRFGRGG